MPMQFGSGSQLLGGTSALNEAMARRGVDASVLNQVGGNAPNAMPMPGAPSPVPMGAPQGGMPQAPVPTPSAPMSESELIIKALSEKLKSESKIKESAVPRF